MNLVFPLFLFIFFLFLTFSNQGGLSHSWYVSPPQDYQYMGSFQPSLAADGKMPFPNTG